MTELQCQSCAKPTTHCQDKNINHLHNAECWNYITKEDYDASLYHDNVCKCPACMEMHFRGFIKPEKIWVRKDGSPDFAFFKSERAPFEQIAIEPHDNDYVETLLHMDGCGCPACVRMGNRGFVKREHKWIMR